MISRKRTACLLLLLLLSSLKTIAQRSPEPRLFLKNGVVSLPEPSAENIVVSYDRQLPTLGRKSLVIVQFNKIPDEAIQSRLKEGGIQLLEYIPDNAYTATLTGTIDGKTLKRMGVRAIYRPGVTDLVEPLLLSGVVPEHARKVAGKIDVTLSFTKSFTFDEVARDLNQRGFELLSESLKSYQILDVRIPEGSVRILAAFPWMQYVTPVAGPVEMLNDKSAASTKANVLTSSAILGYKLNGEGVVIGLGDDSNPVVHADIGKRVINYSAMYESWHGIHVGGTAAGSGLLNEKYRGFAPGSKIVAKPRSQILDNASQLVQDYGMVVTSNTYGGLGGCGGFGTYSYDAFTLDQQAFELPYLMHVFAAGNSGLSTNCDVSPTGFGTVLGNYQSAKNILTVGNTLTNGVIAPASSKGPVEDGRIKPEVAAPGSDIVSTFSGNTYKAASGTSMASPAVTGGAALLYQRYRQLHQQNNPKNALIKALICNGATDQGLPGPDYSYGFGQMNLLRSVTMLDKSHYFTGELSQLTEKTHQIVVPPNTAKLKVLVYWNDPASSMLSGGGTLVNNLDLSITRPGNTKALPKFPSLSAPTASAVPGVDSINNIEQIVLEEPVAGTYTVKVAATRIPQGVQEYFVVYDIIEPSVTITYPLAGEHLTKGDVVNICWESYGDTLSTFNVAYSMDGGSAWTILAANVAADQRRLSWTVPDAATGNAKVRVIRNGTTFANTSGPFTILGVPTVTLQSVQCEGYIALQWNAVAGASDYEVMLSTGDEMRAVGITNALKYTLAGLSRDSTYYVSVRARKDQVLGRRSLALIRKPDNGTCQGTISDNDLALEAVVNPVATVRKFTKTAYSTDQSITIRIKNLDDQPQTRPFEVGYSLGGEMHWESVTTTLEPTGSLDYTFERRADLASVSEATLLVKVRLSGDPVKGNDSLVVKLRQIPNPKLVLPYVQGVESFPALNVYGSISGIQGGQEYDFIKLEGGGRLRTAALPAIGYLSPKAFVLDGAGVFYVTPSKSYLEATFNLSGYHVNNDDLRLNFRHTYLRRYSHSNGVYIRGSSGDPWILVYTISRGEDGVVDNGYKLASIEVTQFLRDNGQEFTTDFQVKWTSEASDDFPIDGYAIDDIRLFKTRSDVELVRLDAPSVSSCDGNYGPDLTMIFKNNGDDDCFNVPVTLTVDGNVSVQTISVFKKDSSIALPFYFVSEIHQEGKHLVKAWCSKGADVNRANDTLEVELVKPRAIFVGSSYLENFESGNGGWYTSGTHSSWQFGTPNTAGVTNAASGQNAWKTNLTGSYNDSEESYLYSPCIYWNYLYSPFLSFSAHVDLEQCGGGSCDMFYVEYNRGNGWERLGAIGSGINWYNSGSASAGFWTGKVTNGWRVFTVNLPSSRNLRIRFVFKSNTAGNAEGVAIDDIHIYNTSYDIYAGASVPNAFGPADTPANDWTHYTIDNRLVASIHPRGQDIGSIGLKTYLNQGPLRISNNQVVSDRSFVINSGVNFDTPVGVRLYVPETDVEKLVNSTDHPNVPKPKSVYDLTITKYSGLNQDGNLANNTTQGWDFFAADKVKKVPFGSGYYLEFETKTFSEFWLAKDFVGTGAPLPVELIGFTAEKGTSSEGTVAHLKWSTASEIDFSHFMVQVAVGMENVKKGLFYDLAVIEGRGEKGAIQSYHFTDGPLNARATRYYRLKMVDRATDGSDGSVAYSSIKSLNFDPSTEWRVFPNPSKGIFKLEPESKVSGPIQVAVFDINGKQCKTQEFAEPTTVLEVDLSSPNLAEGLYLIKVISREGEKQFKVVKE